MALRAHSDSERAAWRPGEYRSGEDLHTVCIRSPSFLHIRELRCCVIAGPRPQGESAAQWCVPAKGHIRTMLPVLERYPRSGFGWGAERAGEAIWGEQMTTQVKSLCVGNGSHSDGFGGALCTRRCDDSGC